MRPPLVRQVKSHSSQEFSLRFLPSMLSELVHYKHLVLSAGVITIVTISQLAFVLHSFMHSKSIFLEACVITCVAFQHCFLQLFVISIKVRSQSNFFGTYLLSSVTIKVFLFVLSLRQILVYGSSAGVLSKYRF